MNKWKMVPVYPSTHKGVAKLLFGDTNMIRKELLKNLNMMAAEAKDLTGCYPAAEAKEAKRRINQTAKVLKLLIAGTSNRMLEALSPKPQR